MIGSSGDAFASPERFYFSSQKGDNHLIYVEIIVSLLNKKLTIDMMMKKVILVRIELDTFIPVQRAQGIVKDPISGKWYFQLGDRFALTGKTNYDLFKEVLALLDGYRLRLRRKKKAKRVDTPAQIVTGISISKFLPIEEEA